jgi:purine-nucleoside phosphorylase
MTELRKQRDEAVAFLRTRTSATPVIGIILGTGLGGLVKEMQVQTVIDYGDIPHFPVSTVESHHGKLIFGTLGRSRWWPCRVAFIITKGTPCGR